MNWWDNREKLCSSVVSAVLMGFEISPLLPDPMREALERGYIEPYIEIGYRLTKRGKKWTNKNLNS